MSSRLGAGCSKSKGFVDNPSWLRQMYWDEMRSTKDIARLDGCSQYTVRMRMGSFGIPIRSCSEGTALKWQDPDYIKKQRFTDGRRQNHKKGWTKERKKALSKRLRRWWEDSSYRKENLARLRQGFREWYADPANRRYGEKHPNWRGGPRSYPHEWTEVFKEVIRERDGHICAICGVGQGRNAHDVHHINYDRDDVREENCITLCHSCHMVTNGKRDTWQAVLYEIREQRGI